MAHMRRSLRLTPELDQARLKSAKSGHGQNCFAAFRSNERHRHVPQIGFHLPSSPISRDSHFRSHHLITENEPFWNGASTKRRKPKKRQGKATNFPPFSSSSGRCAHTLPLFLSSSLPSLPLFLLSLVPTPVAL